MREEIIAFFSLFGSSATLICCALPATIAAIAGGSAVVSLISSFPILVTISHYKVWIFIFAGLLLAFTGILTFRPHGKVACSITGGKGCKIASKFQRFMFWFSLGIYSFGAFMAFAAIYVERIFEITL